MPEFAIERRDVTTLKHLYDLMDETAALRRVLVQAVLAGGPQFAAGDDSLASLQNALDSLAAVRTADGASPDDDGARRVLAINSDASMELELTYEISELRKDIRYLEAGENGLLEMLRDLHADFDDNVAAVQQLLRKTPVNALVSDRDGTVNNYCGRYRSSIQSIYNAVHLTRFARDNAKSAVVLTSAPMQNPGVVDVTVSPEGAMYLAASKGRECLDMDGNRHSYPIAPEQQAVLNSLNTRLQQLTAAPEYEPFTLIGSGLQFKFGQTTIARQDISGSIPEEQSQQFLQTIKDIVAEVDPDGEQLRIEDTGLDVEIILTVEGGEKDFDKGDGVAFLDDALQLGLGNGRSVVCGDTNSDVPMLQAALERSSDARAVFVTRKKELRDRVLALCPSAVIVPEPDELVIGLGRL